MEARQESLPIIQSFMALNGPLPSNRPSTQALSTLDGFLTQPLSILVLSRTTKYCQKAVHYGIQLAKKYDAELYVVHSVHNPFGLEGWNIPLPSLPDLESEYNLMQKEAKNDLDEMINKEAAAGLRIQVIIAEGEITKEVLKIVEEKKIDLLIVRAHQEGRLERFLFGYCNENLIRRLPCSILLVKDEPKAVTL